MTRWPPTTLGKTGLEVIRVGYGAKRKELG